MTFSDKSAQEVLLHAEWYGTAESLIESNKTKVRQWDEGKRRERELIYKRATQDQKAKLEDEKRRKQHLKTIRVEERQRARESASQWKVGDSLDYFSLSPPPKEIGFAYNYVGW